MVDPVFTFGTLQKKKPSALYLSFHDSRLALLQSELWSAALRVTHARQQFASLCHEPPDRGPPMATNTAQVIPGPSPESPASPHPPSLLTWHSEAKPLAVTLPRIRRGEEVDTRSWALNQPGSHPARAHHELPKELPDTRSVKSVYWHRLDSRLMKAFSGRSTTSFSSSGALGEAGLWFSDHF